MNKKSLCGGLHPQKLQTNHLFKIMRITLLLAFVSILSLNAKEMHSQNARVTLSEINTPLEAVINEIENQTEYHQHQNQRHRATLRRCTRCRYRIRNKKAH